MLRRGREHGFGLGFRFGERVDLAFGHGFGHPLGHGYDIPAGHRFGFSVRDSVEEARRRGDRDRLHRVEPPEGRG
ncbi:hypothetical protein [Streptomyces sp. NBC_01013]|uniref:hypothetical protein n=1 Tax=Streptomyces sp. NBC_01013 TaxID=2903718 RepID=UPI00386B890F|nr:hypothetical protein OG538_23365 [Streptomyces sp. NBC_01013]